MMSLSPLLIQASQQAAWIAISSRLVGSSFRYLETLNPKLQQSKVISDPKTVLMREASTISMAWLFSLVTSAFLKPAIQHKNWSPFRVQFLTTVIGTTIAESAARLLAYRRTLKNTASKIAIPTKTLAFPKRGKISPVMYSGYVSYPHRVNSWQG